MNKVYLATALCLALVASGCPKSGDGTRTLGEGDDVTNTSPPEHHHHDEGPHGGHILEFGDYHGEIAHKDGIVTVYILGDDAETAVPLEGATAVLKLKSGEETVDVALAASPQEGEAEGSSSAYASAEGGLPEGVKDIEDIEGSVEIKMGEKTLTATIEHDHDHAHDHDHDKDDDDHDHKDGDKD